MQTLEEMTKFYCTFMMRKMLLYHRSFLLECLYRRLDQLRIQARPHVPASGYNHDAFIDIDSFTVIDYQQVVPDTVTPKQRISMVLETLGAVRRITEINPVSLPIMRGEFIYLCRPTSNEDDFLPGTVSVGAADNRITLSGEQIKGLLDDPNISVGDSNDDAYVILKCDDDITKETRSFTIRGLSKKE